MYRKIEKAISPAEEKAHPPHDPKPYLPGTYVLLTPVGDDLLTDYAIRLNFTDLHLCKKVLQAFQDYITVTYGANRASCCRLAKVFQDDWDFVIVEEINE